MLYPFLVYTTIFLGYLKDSLISKQALSPLKAFTDSA